MWLANGGLLILIVVVLGLGWAAFIGAVLAKLVPKKSSTTGSWSSSRPLGVVLCLGGLAGIVGHFLTSGGRMSAGIAALCLIPLAGGAALLILAK